MITTACYGYTTAIEAAIGLTVGYVAGEWLVLLPLNVLFFPVSGCTQVCCVCVMVCVCVCDIFPVSGYTGVVCVCVCV